MIGSGAATIGLVAVAAGCAAYALLYPLMSGSARATKRQKALVGPVGRAERVRATASRRDQVAQSLRDLDQREKSRTKITIEARIAQAGLEWTKTQFLIGSAALGLVCALAVYVTADNLLLALAVLTTAGLALPRWVLSFLKKRRLDKYLDELPNAMDVIVRGIRSGLPLGDCMRIVASEAREPVRSEFRFLVDQQTLGLPLSEVAGKLHERVPVPESNFFAIVLTIQSKSGGNLSEALGNLSRVLRERKKMKGKIAAMSMEAKSSAAIIGSLPFIVGGLTYWSSPTYLELLWTTSFGQLLLVGSALWMAIGIFVMRKMIQFDF